MDMVGQYVPLQSMARLTRYIRSLLYYVFLSAATIFSNIIRDTRNPQVRDDLASLNMAATFFATLVPGDGPANYAGFMTRMSATLERIARMAVDKDEKRARDPEERDQENQQPGAKRHNHRPATSHPKTRHGHSTLRASRSSNASGSHHNLATAPSASSSSVIKPSLRDLGIPEELEGFPSVNSSGYVVPMSPGSTTFSTSMTQPQPTPTTSTYPPGLGLINLNDQTPTTFQTNIPSWQIPQDHAHNTTNPTTSPLDNTQSDTQSPYSQPSSNNTNIPDSWQVPLTADWSYGDNLWAGLFPTESIAASAQAPDTSLPILSAESFLTIPPEADNNNTSTEPELGYAGGGTGYDFSAGTGAQGTAGREAEQGESLWPNGVLGLF